MSVVDPLIEKYEKRLETHDFVDVRVGQFPQYSVNPQLLDQAVQQYEAISTNREVQCSDTGNIIRIYAVPKKNSEAFRQAARIAGNGGQQSLGLDMPVSAM